MSFVLHNNHFTSLLKREDCLGHLTYVEHVLHHGGLNGVVLYGDCGHRRGLRFLPSTHTHPVNGIRGPGSCLSSMPVCRLQPRGPCMERNWLVDETPRPTRMQAMPTASQTWIHGVSCSILDPTDLKCTTSQLSSPRGLHDNEPAHQKNARLGHGTRRVRPPPTANTCAESWPTVRCFVFVGAEGRAEQLWAMAQPRQRKHDVAMSRTGKTDGRTRN